MRLVKCPSELNIAQPSMTAHTYKLSTWEMEAGRPELQELLPVTGSEFKANLGCMRSCLKEEKQRKKRKGGGEGSKHGSGGRP